MANFYYVNDNAGGGDHEVHEQGCYGLSQARSTTHLGWHQNCYTAVQAAKQVYLNSNGCAHRSPACHTG